MQSPIDFQKKCGDANLIIKENNKFIKVIKKNRCHHANHEGSRAALDYIVP